MEEQFLPEFPPVTAGLGAIDLPVPAAPETRRPVLPVVHGRIPVFPAFKSLEPGDRFAVEHWARQFAPFSDFNFVSLWSWNTDGTVELSWLNDNLVVTFKDYGSSARFFSFLGTNEVVATALTLCRTARESGLEPRLRLIPEVAVVGTPTLHDRVHVFADRGQFDYVLSTEEWATLAGGRFRKKRNAVHHLERAHAPAFRRIDAGRTETQRGIERLFGRWAVQRGCAGQEATVAQAVALRRFFSLDRPGDLLSYGVFVDGELRAYSINEALTGGYAMGHFWRADRTIHGLYPFLLRETSRALLAAGCRYLNTMQDLGQPGLAHAKELDRPHHFLRKYVLAPLDDTDLVIDASMAADAMGIVADYSLA